MSKTTSGTGHGPCYLCGRNFFEPTNSDHVPPLQFHADEVRKGDNLSQLLTIKVHKKCNEAYRLDEEYFVHTLMPLVRGSYAGNALYQEILGKFRQGRNVPLVRMVLNEADPRPSGLVLPGGKVIKRFIGQRIQRIAWKIVRGLYFHHHQRVLPENHITWVSLTAPDEQPPEHFVRFMQLSENEPRGRYPAIFDYRFQNFTEAPPANLHYWAFLIWDRIILTVLFHDPDCGCERCNDKHPGSNYMRPVPLTALLRLLPARQPFKAFRST